MLAAKQPRASPQASPAPWATPVDSRGFPPVLRHRATDRHGPAFRLITPAKGATSQGMATTPSLPPDPPADGAPADPSESVAPAPAATPARPGPTTTAPRDAKTEREARLAAALRENLKRRKAQARARRDPGTDAGA